MATKRNSTSKKVTTKTVNLSSNKNQNLKTMSATTKLSNFTEANLAEYNKTDRERQVEYVEDFRLNAIIETESVIGSLQTNTIPLLELDLKKAERTLETAERDYAKARVSTAYDYNSYLENRASSRRAIKSAQDSINAIKSKIEAQQAQLSLYKEILADLS